MYFSWDQVRKTGLNTKIRFERVNLFAEKRRITKLVWLKGVYLG